MHPVIEKTFGGLSAQYYFRQFIFGLLVSAFVFYMSTQGGKNIQLGALAFITLNTFLYPYARFVYESVVGFVMGENVFFINAIFMLITKFITMSMCWVLSIFIAPVGLAYLYYHHSKAEPQ